MSTLDSQSAEHYPIRVRVQPADIDELGQVNNLVRLRWVQEVAIVHWTARTTKVTEVIRGITG